MAKAEYWYHATDKKVLGSIVISGIEPGIDGVVYLADSCENALKFVVVRGIMEIAVIKIKRSSLDKRKIIETFDHSYEFFKCKAYGYTEVIPSNLIHGIEIYNIPLYD